MSTLGILMYEKDASPCNVYGINQTDRLQHKSLLMLNANMANTAEQPPLLFSGPWDWIFSISGPTCVDSIDATVKVHYLSCHLLAVAPLSG